MEFQKNDLIPAAEYSQCHDGSGSLFCKSLIDGFGSEKFSLFHSDDIPAGVSIGMHKHEHNEEIYYLISGKGILQYDDNTYEMLSGDISLCRIGHSHGFVAVEDCVLVVVSSF